MKRILLIDDNACYNKISKLILNKLFENEEIDIVGFTDSKKALNYIVSEYERTPVETVIFLDINMPVLNGWDILNALSRLPDNCRQYFDIYMLSSSIDPRDKHKALFNPMVKAYLEKPLSNHLTTVRESVLCKFTNV